MLAFYPGTDFFPVRFRHARSLPTGTNRRARQPVGGLVASGPQAGKRKHVTYSFGYEADTAFLPHQRPPVPQPPTGDDAIATARLNASSRLRQSPIGIALEEAATHKRRRKRRKLMRKAEGEAGFLV